MRQMVGVVTFAIGILPTIPCIAEVAEELAMYVITGVEEGARLESEGVSAVWRKVQSSPTRFIAEATRDDKRIRFTLTATKGDACRYEIAGVAVSVDQSAADAAQSINDAINIKVDFSRIERIEIVDGQIAVTGDGLCVSDKVDSVCHQDVTGLAATVDARRHRQAYDKLGIASCKPSPGSRQ